MTLLPSLVSRDSDAKISPQTTTVPLATLTSRSGVGDWVIFFALNQRRVFFQMQLGEVDCNWCRFLDAGITAAEPTSAAAKSAETTRRCSRTRSGTWLFRRRRCNHGRRRCIIFVAQCRNSFKRYRHRQAEMLMYNLFDFMPDMRRLQNLKAAMPQADMQNLSVKGSGCVVKKAVDHTASGLQLFNN